MGRYGVSPPADCLVLGGWRTLHYPSILLDIQNIQRMQSLNIRTQSQFIKNHARNILGVIVLRCF
nr:MAG TPA: hypothetical protein [Caudoviricetes sp.]